MQLNENPLQKVYQAYLSNQQIHLNIYLDFLGKTYSKYLFKFMFNYMNQITFNLILQRRKIIFFSEEILGLSLIVPCRAPNPTLILNWKITWVGGCLLIACSLVKSDQVGLYRELDRPAGLGNRMTGPGVGLCHSAWIRYREKKLPTLIFYLCQIHGGGISVINRHFEGKHRNIYLVM